MNLWLKKLLIFVASGAVYLIGQYFRGVWISNFPYLCLYKESVQGAYCNWPYFASVGLPLITAGEILAVVGIIMLFANERGMRAWLWASLWLVPLGAALVAITPANPSGAFFSIELTRQPFTLLLGIIYVFITLGIVAWTRIAAFIDRRRAARYLP